MIVGRQTTLARPLHSLPHSLPPLRDFILLSLVTGVCKPASFTADRQSSFHHHQPTCRLHSPSLLLSAYRFNSGVTASCSTILKVTAPSSVLSSTDCD